MIILRHVAVAVLLLLVVATSCDAPAEVEPCQTAACIALRSGEVTLAAELDLPPGAGPHPVLVMVHGSGR